MTVTVESCRNTLISVSKPWSVFFTYRGWAFLGRGSGGNCKGCKSQDHPAFLSP